jgi:hypothetical protein
VPSLIKIGQVILEKILNDPTPFLHFCNYLPFEEDLTLYLNKLDLPSPKDNCLKFVLIWPAGSGEEDFQKIKGIFTLSLLSPLGGGLFPLFEQTSPKDDLCQVWFKLAQWFW